MKEKIDLEELKRGGVVKIKGKDLFSIWVKTSCCNLNSEQLRRVADISLKYGRGFVLFATRQIPIIPFINIKDVDMVKDELNKIHLDLDRCGKRVRNINVCYDDNICKEAATNCISLAEKLEKYFYEPIVYKIKIGVSGCKKDCVISRVLNDISFIGISEKRYDAYVGGRLGLEPFVGIKMGIALSEDECVGFVQNYFSLLKMEAKPKERSADIIKRLGRERVEEELNKGLTDVSIQKIECLTKIPSTFQGLTILKIRATCGEVTSKQLRKIADIGEKYGKGIIHFPVRGNPEIPYIDEKDMVEIEKQLEEANLQILKGIDNIQTCFGNYCNNAPCDIQSLLRKVEKKVYEIGIDNIKISGAGCPNSCGIAHLSDIGFMGIVEPEVDIERCNGCSICEKACRVKAIEIINNIAVFDKTRCKYCGDCIRTCPVDAIIEKRKGFAILVGGRDGEDPRLGEVKFEFLSEEEALRITENLLKKKLMKDIEIDERLDLRGVLCPMNFVKTKLTLEKMKPGQILEITLDDGEAIRNVPWGVKEEGHKIIKVEKFDGAFKLVIKRC